MSQFKWVFPTLLVTALITSVPTGPNQIAEAQTSLSGSKESFSGTFTKDNKPSGDNKEPIVQRIGGPRNNNPPRGDNPAPVGGRTGTSRGSNPWKIVFESVPKDNEPPLPPGTAAPRPMGNVCAIAPKAIGNNMEVWNERPLFIWAGPFKRIELRRVGSDQVLWSKALDRQNKILYDGEALQPGQTYEWSLFFSPEADFPPFRTETFRVMDTQKRDRIKQDLQRLDETLKNKKASAEEIARQHALYFVRQQLWLDALQEAYTVENPSPALTQLIQSMPKEICPKPSGQNSVQRR
ncbi:MAG: hypothetical protein AB1589_21560 [Cyanobacteriota bacterium]